MVTTTPTAVPAPSRGKDGFRADIQGLRAIAVLLVVIYHAAPSLVPGGYIGVDVFFVISGFLITTHLLETLQAEGTISLSGFYARRALRILPAAFTVVVLTVVAGLIWTPPLQHEDIFESAAFAALYMPNILAGLLAVDYLAQSAPSPFQHYWSLGIEEQFYLVWPVILVLGWRLFGRSESALLKLTGTLVAASFALCLVMMQFSQPWAFFSLPTRAWELGIGGLAALLMRSAPARPHRAQAGILAWVGLSALLAVGLMFDSRTPFPGPWAAVPVVATALMILGGNERLGPFRALSTPPLQFVGRISYSFYLVHWPLLVIPQAAAGYAHPLHLWTRLTLAALALPMAYVLFRTVEDPARRARPLTVAEPIRTVLASLIATVLICLLAAAGSAMHQQVPLHAGRAIPAAPLSLFPAGTEFVPSNLVPSLRDSSEDTALVYRTGCDGLHVAIDASGCQFGANPDAPVVALFGDSHAASWFPALHALAEQGLIQLDTNTVSTCPSARAATPLEPRSETQCRVWRAEVARALHEDPPDIVLLANFATRYEAVGGPDFTDRWTDGLAATIESLPPSSEVVVIADVPDMGSSPAICLSDHLYDAGDCAVPRSKALRPELAAAEQTATKFSGAAYLDLTDYFCGPTYCPPIIGNRLTHRDHDHLTATFSEALARPLWRELEPMLRD